MSTARALEWVSFLEGATGELYYQTVGMLSTAWTNQFRFNGNGDGTLFYPGTPSWRPHEGPSRKSSPARRC